VSGDFANNSLGAVATLGAVSGNLGNSGVVRLQGPAGGDVINQHGAVLNLDKELRVARIAGRLLNSGTVYFENFGQVLTASELRNAADGVAGYYSVEVDFSAQERTDRLELGAGTPVRGTHVFVVRNVAGEAGVTKGTEIYLINPNADFGNADVRLGAPVQAGLYEFGIASGSATLRTTGYSAAGQTAVNSAGALSTGWFSELDNLHKRLGDLRVSSGATGGGAGGAGASSSSSVSSASTSNSAAALSNAFWLRGYANQLDADLGVGGVSEFKQNQYGADVGYDRAFSTSEASALYVGALAGYQVSRLHFRDSLGSRGDVESAVVGAYAAWTHREGWYVDGLLKGQYFSSDFDSGSVHGSTESYGLGASLEVGRRFGLGAGWFVEPAVQVAYSRLFSDGYVLSSGLHVGLADSDVFRYVESVRLGRDFDLGSSGVLNSYVRGAVERQDSDGGGVRMSDRTFDVDTDGLRGSAGIGANWLVSERTQLYLEYEYVFGDRYERPWSVSVGYRHRF
jgi:outer membrane autotransporter protein